MRFSNFDSTIARMFSTRVIKIDVVAIARPSRSADETDPADPIQPFLGFEVVDQKPLIVSREAGHIPAIGRPTRRVQILGSWNCGDLPGCNIQNSYINGVGTVGKERSSPINDSCAVGRPLCIDLRIFFGIHFRRSTALRRNQERLPRPSASGGETSLVPNPFPGLVLSDISPDHSQLLVADYPPLGYDDQQQA